MSKNQFKRRRKCITDYESRVDMLKSKKPRIVFRKTNKYIIGDYVITKEAQDYVKISTTSKELAGFGWVEKSIKNLPASYLTGFLLGKKIIEKKESKEVILDLGLNRNISKSRIYAFVKGLIDSGVKMSCDAKMLPSEERIQGEHINEKMKLMFNKIKEKMSK